MIKDINYKEIVNDTNYLFIDVRSPKEYSESTIPNAINVPLFDNEERAKVGTIYKEQGPKQATELGIKIVSPKIPELITQINNNLNRKKPVFFCWRGGMRSKTVATLYDLPYKNTIYKLEGGYRAYREYILNEINNLTITIPTFVIHGMTGVGKTRILNKLNDMGLNTLDLEDLAGHRGSIFGGIGNVNPINQKWFDSLIYEKIKDINNKKILIIEAESKRVGKVSVPDNILNAKTNGFHIMVNSSINTRIERIIEDYEPYKNKDYLFDAFLKIEKRLPTEVRNDIHHAFTENNFHKVVELLLIYYYDPRYQHSTEQYDSGFFEVNSDNLDEAIKQIYEHITSKTFASSK